MESLLSYLSMLDNVKTATAPAFPVTLSHCANCEDVLDFQSLFVLISTLPSCFY